jgi:antitoxin YefM
MSIITASEARKRLFPLIEEVNQDADHVVITSKAGNAVLISERQWESWQETMYLLRTPANAKRLIDSISRTMTGEYTVVALPEGDDSYT